MRVNVVNVQAMGSGPASLPFPRFTVGGVSYVPDSHLSVSYEGERPIYRGKMGMLTVPFHCWSAASLAHS